MSDLETIKQLCNAGLYIVPIQKQNNKPSKAPRLAGWNKPINANNPNGYSNNPDDFKEGYKGYNFGLYHGASHTLAFDIDNMEKTISLFDDVASIKIQDWLSDDARVEIKSPKLNRGKLLYTIPTNFKPKLRQFEHNKEMFFELRCGNCQDVIYGQHPEGGNYKIIGDVNKIPDAPKILIDMLQNWDEWKPVLESALGVNEKPPKIAPKNITVEDKPVGWLNPITEFNQSHSCLDILLRNGYIQKGKDRLIRPNSTSKAPAVGLMKNCADGVERVFSHGGDVLNDGYAHDAFDCYRLLECNGEW